MASGFNNNSYGNVLTQSASGTGQWIHAGVNHPMFNGDSAAFTISKSRKVAAEDKLEIARDTLVRLSSVRPMHKTHRNKFDKTNTIHIADKSIKFRLQKTIFILIWLSKILEHHLDLWIS